MEFKEALSLFGRMDETAANGLNNEQRAEIISEIKLEGTRMPYICQCKKRLTSWSAMADHFLDEPSHQKHTIKWRTNDAEVFRTPVEAFTQARNLLNY